MRRKSKWNLTTSDLPKELRKAVWIAHEKRCAYTGRKITEDELVVDHIIPKELNNAGRRREKESVLRAFGLPADFDLYELLNLAPTSVTLNNRKSNHTGGAWTEQISKVLPLAAEKSEKVRNLWKEFDLASKLEHDLKPLNSYFKQHLDAITVAERAYDNLSGEQPTFETIHKLENGHAVLATDHVYMHCIGHDFPRYDGSLLVCFKKVDVRGCSITFGRREIVRLFGSLGSPARLGARSFIVAFDEPKGNYLVQLGNNRLTLPSAAVDDFCRLVDQLAGWYLGELRRSECEVYKSIDFELTEPHGYRMLKVDRRLWLEMLRFAAAHDHERGGSEWHIFEPDQFCLKVFAPHPNDGTCDYRVFIRPEADDPCISDPSLPRGSDVWLRWDGSFAGGGGRTEASLVYGTVWNVEHTCKWIEARLIPAVARWSDHARQRPTPLWRWRRLSAPPPTPASFERANGARLMTIEAVRDMESFERAIANLTGCFRSGTSEVTSARDLRELYEAVKLVLNGYELPESLIRKFAREFRVDDSVSHILSAIDETSKSIDDQGATDWEINSALQIMRQTIEYSTAKITPERLLSQVLPHLRPVFERYNERRLIMRFKVDRAS